MGEENADVIDKLVPSLHVYCEMQGRIQLGISLFGQVLPLYRKWVLESPDLTIGLTKLLVRQSFLYFRTNYFQQVEELINEVKPRLDELKSVDLSEFAFSRALIWSFHDGFETAEEAVLVIEQARNVAFQLDDDWLKGLTLLCLAENYHFRGRHKLSLPYFEQSIEAFEKIGEKRYKAFSLNNLGRAYFGIGQYKKAKNKVSEALAIREAFNDHVGINISRISLAAIEIALQNFGVASQYLHTSLDVCLKISSVRTNYCQNLLGRLALNQGKYEEAKEWFRKNINLRKSKVDLAYMPHSLNGLAYICLLEESYEQARGLLQRSLAISEGTDFVDEKAEAFLYMAFLEHIDNPVEPDRAEHYYQQALATGKIMGAPPQALSHCILVDWAKFDFVH